MDSSAVGRDTVLEQARRRLAGPGSVLLEGPGRDRQDRGVAGAARRRGAGRLAGAVLRVDRGGDRAAGAYADGDDVPDAGRAGTGRADLAAGSGNAERTGRRRPGFAPIVLTVLLPVLLMPARAVAEVVLDDAGFWLVKEYFGLTVGKTIESWSVLETIISVVGLISVLIVNLVI